MSKSASRKLSVIIPWCEGRGEGVNHLRKWSEGQTLPRSDYQIVIGYPEDEPEERAFIDQVLLPGDIVVPSPEPGSIIARN